MDPYGFCLREALVISESIDEYCAAIALTGSLRVGAGKHRTDTRPAVLGFSLTTNFQCPRGWKSTDTGVVWCIVDIIVRVSDGDVLGTSLG